MQVVRHNNKSNEVKPIIFRAVHPGQDAPAIFLLNLKHLDL